jgi:hypothetical protein
MSKKATKPPTVSSAVKADRQEFIDELDAAKCSASIGNHDYPEELNAYAFNGTLSIKKCQAHGLYHIYNVGMVSNVYNQWLQTGISQLSATELKQIFRASLSTDKRLIKELDQTRGNDSVDAVSQLGAINKNLEHLANQLTALCREFTVAKHKDLISLGIPNGKKLYLAYDAEAELYVHYDRVKLNNKYSILTGQIMRQLRTVGNVFTLSQQELLRNAILEGAQTSLNKFYVQNTQLRYLISPPAKPKARHRLPTPYTPVDVIPEEHLVEFYRCYRKKVFILAGDAESYIAEHAREGAFANMTVYSCEYCSGFHMGHLIEPGKRKSFTRTIEKVKRYWAIYEKDANRFCEEFGYH